MSHQSNNLARVHCGLTRDTRKDDDDYVENDVSISLAIMAKNLGITLIPHIWLILPFKLIKGFLAQVILIFINIIEKFNLFLIFISNLNEIIKEIIFILISHLRI